MNLFHDLSVVRISRYARVSNLARVLALSGLVTSLHAAGTYTWDPDVAADVQAGDGTWKATGGATVWTTTGGTSNTAWADASSAVFGGADTGGVITVASNIAVAGTLSFLNSGYTLQSDSATLRTISLSSSPLFSVASGKTVTIGSKVTISGAIIGTAATAGGTINLTGGTFSNSSNFTIQGTSTVINVNAGGSLTAGGSYIFGNNNGDNVSIVVDGGAVSTTGANGNFGMLNSGTVSNASATLTLKSGTVTLGGTVTGQSILRLGSVSSGTGSTATVNLDGGVMTVGSVTETGGAASTFNFNGGTLKAKASANVATFMTNLDNAVVKTGGAKIDSNAQALIVSQIINHDNTLGGTLDGGMEKLGTGSLTLTGANTYTGASVVTAGELATGATGTFGNGNITVADGATLTLGNGTSIADTALLVFNSTSLVNLSFTGQETLGGIQLSVGSSIGAGTYGAGALNDFFGGSVFNGEGELTILAAIPEPSTWALCAGAAALLGALARRRGRRDAQR